MDEKCTDLNKPLALHRSQRLGVCPKLLIVTR